MCNEKQSQNYDEFEVLTAVPVINSIFWDVASCSVVEVYQQCTVISVVAWLTRQP
jgi:hypothetical protein